MYKSNEIQWAFTPVARLDSAYSAFIINSSGNAYGNGSFYDYVVHPAIYLKASVKIESGNGTASSPYNLK